MRTIAEAERAIEAAPNSSTAHAFRGLAMARQGRYLEATRSIRQALRLNPRPGAALLMMTAYVNWGAGRIEEGVELLEQVRSAHPDNVLARLALVGFYEREGRHEEARAVVREMLRVNPGLTVDLAVQVMQGRADVLSPKEVARVREELRSAGLP